MNIQNIYEKSTAWCFFRSLKCNDVEPFSGGPEEVLETVQFIRNCSGSIRCNVLGFISDLLPLH